jgi:hypothetical protein
MKQIDKFEAAVKRVLIMDQIDKVHNTESPESPSELVAVGLEAIEAGISCVGRGDLRLGDDALHEAAVYFMHAGFLAGRKKTHD